MKLVICAVFDSAVQAYGQPIFVPAVGQAIRSFSDEINRVAQDNPFNRHPEDYELFRLSVYDDSTGLFSDNQPELLARGKEVLIPK